MLQADAQGFKKPSPGFIMDPKEDLSALKSAKIEVRLRRSRRFGRRDRLEPSLDFQTWTRRVRARRASTRSVRGVWKELTTDRSLDRRLVGRILNDEDDGKSDATRLV